MSVQLSSDQMVLGKKASQLAMEHLVEWFEQASRINAVAEGLRRREQSRPTGIAEQDWIHMLRERALEEDSAAHPLLRRQLIELRPEQLSLEHDLGALLATQPPQFILAAIGPPPRSTRAFPMDILDGRWWIRVPELNQPLRLCDFWLRVAGAYASVVASQCDGDPDRFSEANNRALASYDSIYGRASADTFSSVTQLVSATPGIIQRATALEWGGM